MDTNLYMNTRHSQRMEAIVAKMRKPTRMEYNYGNRHVVQIMQPRPSIGLTPDLEDDFILNHKSVGFFWSTDLPRLLKQHSNPIYRLWRAFLRFFRGPLVVEPPVVFGNLGEEFVSQTITS